MPGEAENETLVSIFLSGKRSQSGLDPEEDGPQLEAAPGGAQEYEETYKEVEYFPDPPCIAPFDEDEEQQTASSRKALGTNPQEYWKSHAMWQQDDPEMQAPRTRFDVFVNLYNARLGLNQDGTGSSQPKSGTKQKTIRRNATALSSTGDLQIVEAFVNISPNPVGIRQTGSLMEQEKTGEVVMPGECVVVDKVVEDAHIRFLNLADGRGWVFDRNQDAQVMARMDEVEVCNHWYRLMCKEMVDVRAAPVYDDAAKTNRLLSPKELVVVNLKCRVRGHVFMHLADGRGWVFHMKPGSDKRKRTYADTVMEECDREIVQDQRLFDQADILPATNDVVEVGLWTYVVGEEPVLALGSKLHGTYLGSGDILKVDKRAFAHGDPAVPGFDPKRWLRLMDGRGWFPEKGTDGKAVVALQGSAVSYPATFRKKEKITDTPAAAWMMGVA